MSQSPDNLGNLSHSLNAEGESAGWVTFKDAKRQMRALIRAAGLEAQGFFRPRRENRGELLIHVAGGTVSARRKPGAAVVFNQLVSRGATDLSAEELAAIIAQG